MFADEWYTLQRVYKHRLHTHTVTERINSTVSWGHKTTQAKSNNISLEAKKCSEEKSGGSREEEEPQLDFHQLSLLSKLK